MWGVFVLENVEWSGKKIRFLGCSSTNETQRIETNETQLLSYYNIDAVS